MNDALQQLQQQVADKLFLGHLRIIVVSEDFARQQGMEALSDFLVRHPEVRRTVWVVVSKGSASDLMQTAPPLERVPTVYLMSTLDHAKQLGKLPNDFFGMFVSKVAMRGREPILPYVEVMQKDNVNISGLVMFRRYRMAGTTARPFDIATYMLLSGVQPGGYTMMVQIPGHRETVMWQAYLRKRRITVRIENGRPHFTVRVHLDGNITEKSSEGVNLDDPRVLAAIDDAVGQKLRSNLDAFITLTKALHTDPVGFGEFVRARQPGYWDRYVQTKERWEALYPDVKIDFVITVRTHRVGMKAV